MDYLFQDGGKPKKTKSKTGTKTGTKSSTKTGTKTKSSTKTGTKTKSSTKTGTKSKTTKSKSSSKKGGNFLGTVGDLVAPTGWGPFATAAALVGLDRVDAALRRGKSTKSSAKKGGMRGGKATQEELNQLKPAIEPFDKNYDTEFMVRHQIPFGTKRPKFFTLYENYFKDKNSTMSNQEHAKLQKKRYAEICGILDLIMIDTNKNIIKYYPLAKKILEDIQKNYKDNLYDSINTNSIKLNWEKL